MTVYSLDVLLFLFGTSLLFHVQLKPAAAAAKSLQSCPTLCDPIDGSPPGSPVPGILQARTLEWVAMSCSNAWKWKVKGKSLSRARLLAAPWTAAYQAPPSMGSSRQSTGVGRHCLAQSKCLSRKDKLQNINKVEYLATTKTMPVTRNITVESHTHSNAWKKLDTK